MLPLKHKDYRAIRTMQKIKEYNTGFPVDAYISKYRQYRAFTPNQLLTVFGWFKSCGIKYNPKDFTAFIKYEKQLNQFYDMYGEDAQLILKVLTKAQKDYFIAYRNRITGDDSLTY